MVIYKPRCSDAADVSAADFSKLQQIKLKLSAWLSSIRGKREHTGCGVTDTPVGSFAAQTLHSKLMGLTFTNSCSKCAVFLLCRSSVCFRQYRQLAHYFSLLCFLLTIVTLLLTLCCEYDRRYRSQSTIERSQL